MRSLSQAVLPGKHPAVLKRQKRHLSVLGFTPIVTGIPVPAYRPVCARIVEAPGRLRSQFLISLFSMTMEKKGGLYA